MSADTFLIFKQLVSVFSASNHKQATRGGKGRRAAAAEAAVEQQQVEQGRQQGSTAVQHVPLCSVWGTRDHSRRSLSRARIVD